MLSGAWPASGQGDAGTCTRAGVLATAGSLPASGRPAIYRSLPSSGRPDGGRRGLDGPAAGPITPGVDPIDG